MEVDLKAVNPLISWNGAMYVPVSHEELDSLVGQMMQMCDLMGDREQREALKSEIKQRARRWLTNLYEESGYDKRHRIDDVGQIVVV